MHCGVSVKLAAEIVLGALIDGAGLLLAYYVFRRVRAGLAGQSRLVRWYLSGFAAFIAFTAVTTVGLAFGPLFR